MYIYSNVYILFIHVLIDNSLLLMLRFEKKQRGSVQLLYILCVVFLIIIGLRSNDNCWTDHPTLIIKFPFYFDVGLTANIKTKRKSLKLFIQFIHSGVREKHYYYYYDILIQHIPRVL